MGMRAIDQAKPGENGVWSLCPENAGRKNFNVHFIKLPIKIAKAQGKEPPVIDPNGLIYVLHEEEAAIRANDDLKYPLVVRGNIYDCVDWTLTSEWDDDDYTNFQSSKINTHWHFLQFDNQASDGVITGFSYEQSVRPFTMLEKKNKKGLAAPDEHGADGAGEEGCDLDHGEECRPVPCRHADSWSAPTTSRAMKLPGSRISRAVRLP